MIAAELARRRPELSSQQVRFLTAALLGVATSVSFHSVEVPPDLLAELLRAAVEVSLPSLERRELKAGDEASAWAPSRREAIVAAATGLFADRGYADVSIDDIGAAVGIAGPSVYNHFDTKSEILILAMDRGNEMLLADMHRTFRRSASAADALEHLVAGYRTFALENSDLIRLLNTETDQLPPEERARIRATQRSYIAEWTRIVLQAGAAPDEEQARIRVQAVLAVINDIASTPSLRALDGLDSATDAVCTVLLLDGERARQSPD
ncbi:TetR/AcrR family transcriptional regulator [Tsukamurella sp. PLM1]|uniref:TetR/AcrR family transcriptional regulator n=1 Tax=Tsukamurella sp. PLM1 TaxID=2929795 RepID=UPI00206552F5|nr:TetR/AcrR family transcriptional regulator [Tsukamurella sp. PLM1]BDH58551.1 hypothetical protein MTP03_34900 [Tsukamurella sp. PLM1]